MALSALRVASEKRQGMHGDGRGLYLRIGPTGAKSWILRYQFKGQRRDMGLGPVEFVSLAEARHLAHEERRKLKIEKVDPLEAKRAADRQGAIIDAARSVTMADVAEMYVTKFSPSWSNAKHRYQWRQTIGSYINPVIGKSPIADIDTAAVLEVLNPIWLTKATTASRIRSRIETILDFAVSAGLRPSGDNPARWKGHLQNLLPNKAKIAAVVHHPALPYTEIGAFMALLRQRDGIEAAALQFTILTCARSGEALGARWQEIDLERRLWTIPPQRMKARKEHRVALSAPALGVLDRVAKVRVGDLVFPSPLTGERLSHTAMARVLERMGRTDIGVHGFRSCFRDWAAESTGFASELAEMALSHSVGNAVEQAYRRGDGLERRRTLAEAWAAACDSTERSDIVVLNRASA
jgi:integrase